MEVLYLLGNQIGDAGLAYVFNALHGMKALEVLSVYGILYTRQMLGV